MTSASSRPPRRIDSDDENASATGIDPFARPRPARRPAPRPIPHRTDLAARSLGLATPSRVEPAGHLHPTTTNGRPPVGRPRPTAPLSQAHPDTRRFPAAPLAPGRRMAEPPAGLPRPLEGPPPERTGSASAASSTRWPITVAIVLGLVMLLGAGGAVLLARYQSGGPPQGQLIKAGGLSYRVPADWTPVPGGPETSVHDVALDGVATGPRYSCGGHDRARATVGATFLVRRDGQDARAEDAARDFGPLFGKSFYGSNSTATVSAPTPITVGAVSGAATLVTVRAPDEDGCPGLYGEIHVLALPSTKVGRAGGHGVLMLVFEHRLVAYPRSTGIHGGSVPRSD